MDRPHPAAAPLSPRAVRDELAALGHGPRKRFGQNFLCDRHVAERIVAAARLSGAETVVEIGPGIGALTDALAASASHLWLIELDRDLAARAEQRYAADPHVDVVCADALRVDFSDLLGSHVPAVVVANLPYNVGTAILARLVEQPELFSRLVLMLQLEVAQRLVASPGSKAYGPLSVLTQVAADVRITFRVAPTAFVPRPAVESAVVTVVPRSDPPVSIRDRAAFRQVVRTAFTQRRKHLANSLKSIVPDSAEVLSTLGIDPTRRPETLSLAEFAAIADRIAERREATA